MRIELKNVKYAAFASEETSCFEATVYIDGRKAGTVSNEGHGGPNRYHPRTVEETLNAYGKTLPPMVFDGTTLEMDADLLVDEQLNDHLQRRDFTRLLKSHVLFVDGDGKIRQTKKLKPTELKAVLDHKDRYFRDTKTILNLLPYEEAFAIYKKTGGE